MAKILLATNHESVRQRFVDVLVIEGHQFVTCNSAERVDLVLQEGLHKR
jgi:hypothetical protein